MFNPRLFTHSSSMGQSFRINRDQVWRFLAPFMTLAITIRRACRENNKNRTWFSSFNLQKNNIRSLFNSNTNQSQWNGTSKVLPGCKMFYKHTCFPWRDTNMPVRNMCVCYEYGIKLHSFDIIIDCMNAYSCLRWTKTKPFSSIETLIPDRIKFIQKNQQRNRFTTMQQIKKPICWTVAIC